MVRKAGCIGAREYNVGCLGTDSEWNQRSGHCLSLAAKNGLTPRKMALACPVRSQGAGTRLAAVAGRYTMPIWPGLPPHAQQAALAESVTTTLSDHLVADRLQTMGMVSHQ